MASNLGTVTVITSESLIPPILEEVAEFTFGVSADTIEASSEVRVRLAVEAREREIEKSRRDELWGSIVDSLKLTVGLHSSAEDWASRLRSLVERADGRSESLREVGKNVPLNAIVDEFLLANVAAIRATLRPGEVRWFLLNNTDGAYAIPSAAMQKLKNLAAFLITESPVPETAHAASRNAWESLIKNVQGEWLPVSVFVSIAERQKFLEVYAAFFGAEGGLLDRVRIEYRPKATLQVHKRELPTLLRPFRSKVEISSQLMSWLQLIGGTVPTSPGWRKEVLADDPRKLLLQCLFQTSNGAIADFLAWLPEECLKVAAQCVSGRELDRQAFWEEAEPLILCKVASEGRILITPQNPALERLYSSGHDTVARLRKNWSGVEPWSGMMLGELLHDSHPSALDSPIVLAVAKTIESGHRPFYFHEWEAYPIAFASSASSITPKPGSRLALWVRRLLLATGFHRTDDEKRYDIRHINGRFADRVDSGIVVVSLRRGTTPFLRLDLSKPHSSFASRGQREFPQSFWSTYAKSAESMGERLEGFYYEGQAPEYGLSVRSSEGEVVQVDLRDAIKYGESSTRLPTAGNGQLNR